MDQKDHDALIRLETKIEQLCKTVGKIDGKIDEQQLACTCRVADCHKIFASSKLFYWSMALIIAALIAIGGLALKNQEHIHLHTSKAQAVMIDTGGNYASDYRLNSWDI